MYFLREHLSNKCNEIFKRYRPFLSYPKPLFQSEANCKAIDVKMIFYSHANVTHFHYKGFVLSLVLKVKGFGTRKWPIGLSRDLRHFKAFIIKKILEISKISLYVMTNLGEKWLIGRGMKQKCTKIAISWIHFVHP